MLSCWAKRRGSERPLYRVVPALAAIVILSAGAPSQAQRCEDEPLSAVASALLLDGQDRAGPEELEALAREEGSDRLLLTARRGNASDDWQPWLDELARRHRAPIACGAAEAGEQRWVVAAPVLGSLRRQGSHLAATVSDGIRGSYVAFVGADGALRRLPFAPRIRIPRDMTFPLRAQLVAEGPAGPRPVAQLLLGEGAEAPSPLRTSPAVSSNASLTERVIALRSLHEVRPVRHNRLLAQVARRHAQQVCRARRAAHVLREGDPEERLQAAGIEARVVGEVVARARDRDAAFEALLQSPSHRMTMVDARFTDVGVGVAQSAAGVCVVMALATFPRYVGH